MNQPALLSPYKLRNVELENRIMVSPMGQYSCDETGCASDWQLVHLGGLALSGAAIVMTEATAVEPAGRVSNSDLGIWSDAQIAPLRRILDFARQHSRTRMGMQLAHSGRKGSVTKAWEGQRPVATEDGGWDLWSASDTPHPGRVNPLALDREGLKRVRRAFAEGARRADACGFDLVEIHGAHGYLLHSFLSTFGNARTDEYGGSFENRIRFLVEVFDEVREVWPSSKPVGIRISATDWAEGGWSLDDSIALCKVLKARGCDYVTASSGGVTSEQKLVIHPGYQVPFAEAIKREAGLPVIAVGLITEPRQAEDIIQSGQADMVALGRGMLFNPRWPWVAAVELGGSVFYPRQYERAHPAMRRGDFLKPRES